MIQTSSIAVVMNPMKPAQPGCVFMEPCILTLNLIKLDDFRDGQLEAMLPIMHGKDVFISAWLPVLENQCACFSPHQLLVSMQ